MKIVSAITTCPRAGGISYLEATLASLSAAGFEPEIVQDEKMAGSMPALREALQRLLERSADAFIVFQDDILVAKGCREWLESQLWPLPEDQVGIVSLYTASPCHLRPGWFSSDELPVLRCWGGLGLVFTRHFAEIVLSHKDKSMLTGSDTQIAGLCRKYGLAWMNHSPSLIRHIGEVSAIQPLAVLDENRREGVWCEDVRDLRTTSLPARSV